MSSVSDMFIMRFNRTLPIRVIITISKIIGYLAPFQNRSGLFFFFPFCHVGGAEKVHADIVECFAKKKPWVFFTKKSANEAFRRLFAGGRTIDCWILCKYGYPFGIGILAGFINRHPNAIVFGANSLVYYLLLPYLRADIRKVDLIHAFGGGAEEFSLPVVGKLDARVVITAKTREELTRQYQNKGLGFEYAKRIALIENRVDIPAELPRKNWLGRLSVLYVGRATAEKRIHLLGSIASVCAKLGLPVDITIAGAIPPHLVGNEVVKLCRFTGEIQDQSELNRLYSAAHLLLLTSNREGFPLVIMEAMAHGVTPVTTAVGGIPEHVRHGENGWLMTNSDDEAQIVEDACSFILMACSDRRLLEKMSRLAYEYAADHFSSQRFCQSYRSVLSQGDDSHA